VSELSELAGQNIVVFDLETKNEIDPKKGIGWTSYDKMGISVGVLFCFRTMDYQVYMDDNLEELAARINEADLISGFNINRFDIPLLRACVKTQIAEKLPLYDLLVESKLAAGAGAAPRGMKLDDHLEHTFGEAHMKTAHGAEAPIYYQQGKIGRLVSYCIADVKREAKLFRHVWNGQPVKSALHPWRHLKDPRSFMLKPEALANAEMPS
jgi:hypothetical protein